MKNKILFLTFCLSSLAILAQSSSDTCSDANSATHITSAGTYSITSYNGTAPSLLCSSGSVASNGEWFAYTPSNDYQVIVSSDIAGNNGKDTRVQIYEGSCGALSCLVGSDDDGTIIYSRLSVAQFNVTAGQTYYISWDDKYDSTAFDFTLSEQTLQPISFTHQTRSGGGTLRAAVDMNKDDLDDIVSIVAKNVMMLMFMISIFNIN